MAPGKDLPWIVVPMTGTRPFAERITHVELDRKVGGLDLPMWILCEYPTTVPQEMFHENAPRGVLPREIMAQVRHKLAWVLGIGPSQP